ncbi:MAG: hypothetical protein IT198_01810 [Acidimicrobiia bacterium]|nr:hypothetical protein [Acidimicrobiia bacterium]
MRRRTLAAVTVFAVTAVIVTGLPMPPPAAGAVDDCNIWWDGGAGTDSWHDAANWDSDTVPANGAVVCIPGGAGVVYSSGAVSIDGAEVDGKLFVGGGSLSVDGEAVFKNLSVEGGTLTGTGLLTVTEEFFWAGGEVSGSGTLSLEPAVAGSVYGSADKTLGRHLRNLGHLTWSAGDMLLATDNGRDARIENLGTLTISGNGSAHLASGTDVPWIINGPDATIEKTGAAAARLGNQNLNIVNDGTVSVAGGTLWLDGVLSAYPDSTPASSAWTVAAGGTLKLSGADIVTNSDDISLLGPGAGIVDHADADALRNLSTNSGTLRLGGGRDLDVAGDFTNNGTLALGPGSAVAVSGDFHAGTGTLLTDVVGTTAANFGTVTATGTAHLGGTLSANVDSSFTPANGDEFAIVDATALSGTFASVTGDLHIRYDTAAGNAVLTATNPYAGCDTVFLGTTSDWHTATNWSGGEVPSGDDTACIPEGLTALHSSGSSAVNALRADGTVVIQEGGDLTVWTDSSIAALTMNGGSLTGDGVIEVTGTFDWSGGNLEGAGTLTVVASATAEISGAGSKVLARHLRNDGSLTWSAGTLTTRSIGDGHPHLDNYGSIAITGTVSTESNSPTTPPLYTNHSGATITKTDSGTAVLDQDSTFVNDGTVRVLEGELALMGEVTALIEDSLTGGTWEVLGGSTLRFDRASIRDNAATVVLGQGAEIVEDNGSPALESLTTNYGTLILDATDLPTESEDFANNGTLALRGGSRLGLMGDYTQSSGARFEVGIAGTTPGTGYGQILAPGSTATLAGTLSTTLVGGFTPGPSDAFKVIDAGSIAGTFTAEGPLTPTYDTANGDVVVSVGGGGPACTITWDGGGGSANWGTAANWNPDVVPGASDVACIPEGSTVSHASGNSTVGAVTAEGTLTVSGGTLTIAGESSIANLNVSNGRLDGDADISVDTAFNWTNGTISGAGTLTVAAGATGSISTGNTKYLERHLVNEGALTWSDGNIILHGLASGLGHLDNAGTFTVSGDDGAQWFDGGTAPKVTNRAGATITKTGTALATLGSGGVVFVNDGTITSAEGTLRVGGGGAGSGGSGSWTLPGGGITFWTGTWELTGNISGLGTLGVSGGTVRMSGLAHFGAANTAVSGGTLDLDSTPVIPNITTTLALSGGALSGDGDLSVGGQFNWTNGTISGAGTLTVAAGATGSISTGNTKYLERHLVNEGALTWSDGNIILHGLASGLGHLDNAGTFTVSGDDGAQWFDGGAAPKVTNRAGATIVKTGTALATLGSGGVVFVNDGTIAVGSSSRLNVGGPFTQGATGRLEITIAGTSPGSTHGRLDVAGAATLGGTLAAILADGYTPGVDDEFAVYDATTLSGTFAAVEGPLTPRYDLGTGTVTLFTDVTSVPPTVVISPQSTPESGMFMVVVQGVGGNIPVTVPFQVVAGTAQTPADYSTLLTPATVTVNPDAATLVPVTIVDDTIDEDDETLTVAAGGASAPVTIVDDDDAPTAVIDGLSITESDGETIDATLAVRLVDPVLGLLPQESAKVVTVGAATHDGTALAGSDYIETIGNVVFAPGETTKYFAVAIIGDTEDEDDEQFSATIAAAGNVTVPEGESATVTIVDDDATGGPGSVADELETGGAALFDVLDNWGSEYDLDRSGPSPFELPGLTDELASLYEPEDDLDDLDSPFDDLSDDLEALCDQLQLRGLTVDWVEGGVCGHPAPPTAADIIQVRYTARLSDLAEAAGFSGDEFNDDTEGVLDGLVSSLGLDADYASSADVVVTLVLGVDETGFYVANESGLRLEADATATVDGAGAVAGIDGLDVSGPATVDVAVLLTANGGSAKIRAADLAAPPSSYLRPAAEGTVGLHLEAALAPLALRWDSTFTLTVDEQFQTDIDIQASLEGTLTLPGLTADGDPAEFDLVGTFDGTTWTLTGEGASGAEYLLHGFGVEELGFTVVLTPDAFHGSAALSLEAVLGGPETPLAVACVAAFDHSTFHVGCHLALDEATIGDSPTLAFLGGVTVDGAFDGDIGTGDMTGSLDVAAATLVVLPRPAPPGQIPEGAARAEDVTGSLDSDGNLALHAGLLTGSIGGKVDFSAADVDFSLGPDATGPVFAVDTVTATIPSLNGLGVTFSGFHLNRDGTFGAESISVASQGFLQTIGLGGILPFDITEVTVDFPDHEDLDSFQVTVTGHFDFAAMEALPFTPVVGLGVDPVTPSSPPEDNIFTFSIAVDSLSEGQVRPWDLGPITLGFDDLEVGDVTLGAQLTLGGYEAGEWVDDFGGRVSIESGLDDVAGDATVDVGGALDITPTGANLDLTGTFSISAALSEDVSFEGASLDFGLGIAVDDAWNFTITGPTFSGAGIDRVEIAFGEYMHFVGTNVGINFAPAPGQPLVSFGGRPCEEGETPPCDGSARVMFDDEVEVLSGWGGEVGNFAVDGDLVPRVLPGFFFNLDVPDDERFGLPDWLPLRIDDFGIRFPDVDLANIPAEGIPLTDLVGFVITFSGGLEATDKWPISAAVDGLEVDLGKLARGEFPITNLSGFKMGVEPFELVPGFEVGGGLELGTIPVDGDPAPGEQLEDVFYGRVFGQFEYEGVGAGIDLVVTQYGPVLAQVLVPLAIPLDGGLLGGIMLSGVKGGLAFGGKAFPDPDRPLDIIHDDRFNTDFPINVDTIRERVEPAVQTGGYTWDSGFTMALSGTMTHAMAPAIVTGDVTIGMNVGLIPGQEGVKFIGKGDLAVWGGEFAGAALLMDLTKPLEPKFDFAFETPQPGNPLGFLLPASAQLEASLDTKGILPGFALGVATFVQRAGSGTLEVGQDFFDATLDALAVGLEGDHKRPFARLLLDTDGDGLVSGGEDGKVITRKFLTSRALTMMGGGGLPADPVAAGNAARLFAADLLSAAGEFTDDFDLSAVFNDGDYAAFAQLLGAGYEAVAAFSGVVKAATLQAGQAFWDQFDPSFHLRGMLQPVILGIPFGEPQHEVEAIISKTGLGFGFDTSIGDMGMQLCDRIIPVISGAFCRLMTLGFEDHLGMTFELPIGGILEGLFGGSGVPTIDPMSGDWAIELRGGLRWLDFEVGQMSGLVVAADNPAFLDAHVQKLYENPDAPLDPSRIPIQTEQHYQDIVDHGGILLTGRLLLPELLTDPVGLLSELNLEVPDNILDMPDWIADIADHLGRSAQPASVQLYVPGFGDVFAYDFDATTDAERISPIGSGRRLARAFNDISGAAYIEGTFDGTLLSVPFGKAVVTTQDQKLQVRGEQPLIGLDATFDLDVKPTLGTDGTVDLPRAMATTTIDSADVDDVLARFGLPPLVSPVAGVDATFRAVSPGYDPSSADPLLRAGGIEISSRLRIAGILNNARYRMSLSPNGDVAASAGITAFTPVPGITLRNATVGFSLTGGSFQGNLAGTVNLDDWLAAVLGVETVAVQGTFDTAGNVSLSIGINGVTYDLVALMNASIDQIVDFLVGLGYDFVAIAEILWSHVTRSATTIVDQLVRTGARALDIVEALYGSVTRDLRVLVQQLVRVADQIGADFAAIAAALDAAATAFTDGEILNAIDDFTNAALWQLVDALEAMGRTTLSQLINMLEAIGYTDVADLAAALDAAATAFTDGEILNALDDFTEATLGQLVDALQAMGKTALGTIIDMLEAIGYTDIRDLAEALDDATSASYRLIAEALDDFTGASFNVIGDALRSAGAGWNTVVDALDWATNATVSDIADAIRYAGASFTQVMRALEAELRVTRYDTAAELQRLGASITEILDALVAVYDAGFNSLVNVLVSLGVALADAIAAVTEFLGG